MTLKSTTIRLLKIDINSLSLSKIYVLPQSFFLFRKVWLKSQIMPIYCNCSMYLKLILTYRFPCRDFFFLWNSFVEEMGPLSCRTSPSLAVDDRIPVVLLTQCYSNKGSHRPTGPRRDEGLVSHQAHCLVQLTLFSQSDFHGEGSCR